ncbi:MAG: L-glutamate gamma-semialdehyde dehydrogenase [Bacteroidales bacterium]|nr:L-glutamate gamma-semialdehyde dehydrogenase [Bacteroidales bacterium]
MSEGRYIIPEPTNEIQLSYAPGSRERDELKKEIKKARSVEVEISSVINGKHVQTGDLKRIEPPHDIKHTLGYYHQAKKDHVMLAVDAAISAKEQWLNMPWEERAAIFLKAADLIAGPYRWKMNVSTMLGQSKNPFQAEIDAACEMIDFFRFNIKFMERIFEIQPRSVRGIWNRTDWRPLEGFVFALTPFNFTSIAGNLPTAPAMLGNTVVWKPSKSQVYSARVIMEVLQQAGLPDGVINLVYAPGPDVTDVVLNHEEFGGIHFTGSTTVFQSIWNIIGNNISKYKSYPRIVGETGGKDFVIVHQSAEPKEVATALARGAFEYQGQKCSAASRAYIPSCLWDEIRQMLEADLNSFKMGGVEDFSNFINAVIDEKSFDKLGRVIDKAKEDKDVDIIMGGGYNKTAGYFIEPTVILTKDPEYYTMKEELFGPILTVYIYPEEKYQNALKICDKTSPYALTGAVFARDKQAIELAHKHLRYAAGNFYINDKPTGAVVSQQPFGGARGSGTNDKAGSMINLLRWLSPRSLKENFNPPTDYRYPFLEED